MCGGQSQPRKNQFFRWETTQLTFTCSGLTVETLGKGVKYVQN